LNRTVTIDGVDYEVVWDGGEGLVGERNTKPGVVWNPPKRNYNKKSDYWKKREVQIINPLEE
jgi:hypothetical protein